MAQLKLLAIRDCKDEPESDTVSERDRLSGTLLAVILLQSRSVPAEPRREMSWRCQCNESPAQASLPLLYV